MAITKIGIIGLGGIANGKHIAELVKIKEAQITAICDINEEKLKTVGDKLDIDSAHRFVDYHDLIACPDVEAVEICTPNYLHVPMAIEAVEAGKFVNVEKPLAMSVSEAEMLQSVLNEHKAEAMICFSNRFRSTFRYARHLIKQGAIGKVLTLNIAYLKDSGLRPGRKLEWRFIKEYAGTGVLGDLAVHLIDMAQFLVGDIKAVCSQMGVIVDKRPKEDGSGMGNAETDDFCSFLAEMDNDVHAVFDISRRVIGQTNGIHFIVCGDKGTLSCDVEDPDNIGIASRVIDADKPKMHNVPVPEEFFAGQEQCFVDFTQGKKQPFFPDINEGVRSQKILEAVEISAKERRWVDIKA